MRFGHFLATIIVSFSMKANGNVSIILAHNEKDNSSRIVIVVCLLIFGAFFALYKLSESPSVWYDEGIYYQMAENVALHGKVALQTAPGTLEHFSKLSAGYPLLYPIALAFNLFGVNIITARSVMVIFLFLTLVFGLLLIKKSFGGREAVYALALLASFAPLYGNGKSVLGEVPGVLFMVLSLLSLHNARANTGYKKVVLFSLAGFSAGLSVATKQIFIVLIVALIVAAFVKRRVVFDQGRKLIWFVGFFVLAVVIWLVTQFQIGDSILNILSFYADPQSVGNLSAVVISNIKLFFTDMGPAYLLVVMLIWTSSLITRKIARKNISMEEIIAFTFSLLVGTAFLRTAGYYRYLFPAQILSLLYLPNSLVEISNYVREKFSNSTMIVKIFSIKAVGGLIVIFFIFGAYQLSFDSWVADYYESRKTAFWQEYFSKMPENEKIFFYNTPEIAMFSRSKNYFQYLDLSPAGLLVGEENIILISAGQADKIILKTGVFNEDKERFLKHYHYLGEAYKYAILANNKIK